MTAWHAHTLTDDERADLRRRNLAAAELNTHIQAEEDLRRRAALTNMVASIHAHLWLEPFVAELGQDVVDRLLRDVMLAERGAPTGLLASIPCRQRARPGPRILTVG